MRKSGIIMGVLGFLLGCGLSGAVAQQYLTRDENIDSQDFGVKPVFTETGDVGYWVFDEDMEQKVDELALDPVREKYGIDLDPDMMSRCVSYVSYTLSTDEESGMPYLKDGFYYGEVQVYEGCDGPVADPIPFRIATDGTLAQLGYDGEYISIEEWLAL